jgi:hypothetical protein
VLREGGEAARCSALYDQSCFGFGSQGLAHQRGKDRKPSRSRLQNLSVQVDRGEFCGWRSLSGVGGEKRGGGEGIHVVRSVGKYGLYISLPHGKCSTPGSELRGFSLVGGSNDAWWGEVGTHTAHARHEIWVTLALAGPCRAVA